MDQKPNFVDWNSLLSPESVHQAAEQAAEETDTQISEKIARLTSLKQSDIEETFPEKSDQKKLAELLRLVHSSKTRQDKVNAIVNNAEKFAGIIVSLLKHF